MEISEARQSPSKVPMGSLVSAVHHVTEQPATVKVGQSAVYPSAAKTVRQPVYLRHGNGIYLKKYQKPRRTHYGPNPPARLTYVPFSMEEEEMLEENVCQGDLAKVLQTPGVVMTTMPVNANLPANHPLWVAWRNKWCNQFAGHSDIQRMPSCLLDVRSVVRRRPRRSALRLTDTRYILYDHEEMPRPPPFFLPPSPLPEPVIEDQPSSSSSASVEMSLLLRRPLVPIIWPSSGSSMSSSSDPPSIRMTSFCKIKRRQPVPPFVPTIRYREDLAPIVTSSRVQGQLVKLGDWFPYGAEQGLLAEILFYSDKKNFPLLLRRSSKMSLDAFTARNSIRTDPHVDLVPRVDTLRKRVAQQAAMVAAAKADDSDLEGEELAIENRVFNPLTYSFNRRRYARYV